MRPIFCLVGHLTALFQLQGLFNAEREKGLF